MGREDRVSTLKILVQLLANSPNNSETPRGIVRTLSLRSKINGHQKSFQIGIILNMATVASAGRMRGKMIIQ